MRLLIAAVSLALATGGALAQDKDKQPSAAQKKQQTRMKECNERAADKDECSDETHSGVLPLKCLTELGQARVPGGALPMWSNASDALGCSTTKAGNRSGSGRGFTTGSRPSARAAASVTRKSARAAR